jgi:hypothetical protein
VSGVGVTHKGGPDLDPTTTMMRLKKMPADLFNPLAAPGRDVYISALIRIYALSARSHGLLERRVVVEAVEEALADEATMELTDEVLESEPQFGADETDSFEVRRRTRAQSLVRYLERCGWFRTEMQPDQSASLVLYDHSFRILDGLNQFVNAQATPLQGLVCSIHDLLLAASQGDNVSVRVSEAARQCEHMLNALRELEHTIGLHMEQLLQEREVKAVLRRLLLEYSTDVIDAGYHKLKTTDHVSRYRPALLAACHVLLESSLAQHGQDGQSDAARPARSQLLFISDAFENLDATIERIDDRHRLFVDAAVRRVEKMMTGQTTVSGSIQAVLQNFMNTQFIEGSEGSETDDGLHANARQQPARDDFIQLFCVLFVDSSSLHKPRKESARFQAVHRPPARVSRQALARARKQVAEQLGNAIGKNRVRELADMLLDASGKQRIRASELNIGTPDQLAMIMSLRAYGDGSLGYLARDVTPRMWVRKTDIGFFDFYIESVAETPVQTSGPQHTKGERHEFANN